MVRRLARRAPSCREDARSRAVHARIHRVAAIGSTRNPWDPPRTSGGSSGGSPPRSPPAWPPRRWRTDGAGSIRIPAANCGLFGLKPQRGRLPVPRDWNGMTVPGALTRGVIDGALFLDAAAEPGPVFADAARRGPGALRIAYSSKVPRGRHRERRRRAAPRRRANRRAAARPRPHVVERDPDYGNVAVTRTTRYLDGVRAEAETMAHPERLARRSVAWRAWARGPVVPRRPRARAGGGGSRADRRDLRRLRRADDARPGAPPR